MENEIVRKPNEFIQAGQKMDVYQLRILYQMLAKIKAGSEEKTFEIATNAVLSDLSGGDVWQRLDTSTSELMRQILIVDTAGDREKYNVVSYCKLVRGKGIGANKLFARFSPDVVPILMKMVESGYTKIFLQYVIRMRSSYSVRLYELLRRWKDQSSVWSVSVDNLKFLLGCEEKYPLWQSFKGRVLSHAQKDLEKYTDIAFEIQLKKDGPKVKEVIFLMRDNAPSSEPINQEVLPLEMPPRKTGPDPKERIISKYVGLKPEMVAGLSNVDLDRLRWAHDYVSSSTEVKNPAGLFIWACTDPKAEISYRQLRLAENRRKEVLSATAKEEEEERASTDDYAILSQSVRAALTSARSASAKVER